MFNTKKKYDIKPIFNLNPFSIKRTFIFGKRNTPYSGLNIFGKPLKVEKYIQEFGQITLTQSPKGAAI